MKEVDQARWKLPSESCLFVTDDSLGAYLRDNSDEDVEEALRLLATDSEKYSQEFENIRAADLVLERFGMPTFMPSLGVPTFHYGHEPPNRFATWQAKFFSNAIREAGLIAIANGGIIYCPGNNHCSLTRKEVQELDKRSFKMLVAIIMALLIVQ